MEPEEDSQSDKTNPDPELRTVDDTYVLDASSGLYEPKPYASQNNIERTELRGNKGRPIFLDVKRDWVPIIVSILALGVGIGTLWLLAKTVFWTRKQWEAADKTANAAICANKTAQDAIRQAREQFVKDQRPYVWITTNGFGTPEYYISNDHPEYKGPRGQITWTFHYINYGRSPAIDFGNTESEMKLGVNGRFIPSYKFQPLKVGNGIPLPPTEENFGTVISQPGATRAQFDEWMKTDYAISIRVHQTYRDMSGNRYDTVVCLSHLVTGAITFCAGNSIK